MIRRVWILLVFLLLAACSSQPEQPPQVQLDAERLLERGVAAYQQGHFLAATSHFQRALVQFQGFDHRPGQVQAHLNLASTLLQLGRLEAASEQAQAAQDLASALDLNQAYQQAQLLLARLAWLQQDPSLARERLEPLLPTAMEAMTPIQLSALALRTRMAQQQADFDVWLATYRQAVAQWGGVAHQRRLERFEAYLEAQRGDDTSAQARLEQVLAAYRREVQRPQLAATLQELGDLALQVENLDAAEDYYQRALRVRLQLQDRLHAQQLLLSLAEVYQAGGQDPAAQVARQQAAELQEKSEPSQ